jgi:preprotein translocase subunit SecG
MASAFGGGSSQTAFGARGGATVLTKATTVLAVLFMVGALLLAIIGQRGPGSILSGTPAPRPVTPAPAAPAPSTPSQSAPATATPAPPGTPSATTPAPANATPEKAPTPEPAKK